MLLCACGHRYDARLAAIDSIIEDHADSARVLLETFDTSDASTANRMYYYLLLADACNKCYDTLPSDNIMQEVGLLRPSRHTQRTDTRPLPSRLRLPGHGRSSPGPRLLPHSH